MTVARSWLAGALVVLSCGGEPKAPPPPSVVGVALRRELAPRPGAALPPPACVEEGSASGPWPRAMGFVRARRGAAGQQGALEQELEGRGAVRLRFLGAHLFDLLEKVHTEGGTTDTDRRRLVCEALNDAAARGAPVIRLWGSRKTTGSELELEESARALALVLDEDARRERPLRFVIALLNEQAGYGAPDPTRSLEAQDPASGWDGRRVFLAGGWRERSRGLLAARIERFAEEPSVRGSPYVLAWELVNELEIAHLARGDLRGASAEALRRDFLVPALELTASRLPQPIVAGELRAPPPGYDELADALVGSLSEEARGRLVWTSHVYAERGGGHADAAGEKLDRDLGVAARHGLPFLLGELGQHLGGPPAGFCAKGTRHELGELLRFALEPSAASPLRGAVDQVIFWGEGECALGLGAGRVVVVGAGGDSADLAADDAGARAALRAARSSPRFALAP